MNNNNINYSSLLSNAHDNFSSSESLRIYDSSYNPYSSHSTSYSGYTTAPAKIEAFEYNYWPGSTTTHNLLGNPPITVLDSLPTSSCSNQTSETLVPVSSVQLPQTDLSGNLASNPHHSHQRLYQLPPSSPLPTCNDSTAWLGSGNYHALHSNSNLPSYRHYPNSCSFYSPNHFYDPSQSQWTSPSTGQLSLKFESSYSPPPYFDVPNHLNHSQQPTPKDELSISLQQSNWHKSESSSTKSTPIPPKNPMNGKTRTRDKYRVVYTDQQRYELENEFILSKYISITRKSALSLTLSLSERQIKIWFQNRRAKERKLNKKRQDISSSGHLNNSNGVDSPSDGGPESPKYYSHYT